MEAVSSDHSLSPGCTRCYRSYQSPIHPVFSPVTELRHKPILSPVLLTAKTPLTTKYSHLHMSNQQQRIQILYNCLFVEKKNSCAIVRHCTHRFKFSMSTVCFIEFFFKNSYFVQDCQPGLICYCKYNNHKTDDLFQDFSQLSLQLIQNRIMPNNLQQTHCFPKKYVKKTI